MNPAQLLRREGPTADAAGVASLADTAFFVDLACVVVSLVAFALIGTDSDGWIRPPIVLVFTLFVPGWTIVRRFGAPASALFYIGAVGLSLVVVILLGESVVLFSGWKWFPVGLALTAGCCVVGTRTIGRLYPVGVSLRRSPWSNSFATQRVATVSVCSVITGNMFVVVGIRLTQHQGFDALGLIGVLSPVFWIGVAILVGGLIFVCSERSRWAWLNIAALVTALHGLPGMLEPNPRFNVAYVHTGFIEHIASEGTLLRQLDARFSWAGFFTAGGLIQRWTGTDSLLWLVRYAPIFYNGVAVVLVALLARRMRATEMQSVAAAALFCCVNWIGQDYFAPQATAFVLYLVVVTVVLYAFPADPSHASAWLVRLARPAMDRDRGLRGREAALVLVGCHLLVIALIISHQLTPSFLLTAMFLLVVVNATRLRAFPVFIAVVFFAWLSFGAAAYWYGHFENLTGSVGQVGDLVSQNVGKRTESPLFARRVVLASRIALALFAWVGATVSIVSQWRRRSTPIALVCLLVAPFPMLVLQPYGGEMALRVCYFSLPPACILIVQLMLPGRWAGMRRWVVYGVALLVLTPLFITARFGNESFEAFSNDDIALVRTLYDVVPDGSTVFVATQQTVEYSERVAEVRFRSLPRGTPTEVTELLQEKYLGKTRVFVVLSESQQAHGVVSLARPADWMQVLRRGLQDTGQYRVVAEVGAGVLLELEPA
jgi:uncharacterized membrane protein YhaH (DUF805 family)